MSNVIAMNGVSKVYPRAAAPSLNDINLEIAQGEFVAFVGPSGCGKSTLIKIISGLEQATTGQVETPESVAMVFQSGALFPWLTIAQNVDLVLRAKGVGSAGRKRKVHIYLEMVGLLGFADKYPRELSGGQRQRVGLARALSVDPEVLVLDEPFAALDIKTTEMLHQDLLGIWKETGKTILLVSHSIEEAVTLADRVVLMNAGHITNVFDLSAIARPRREQAHNFIEEVQRIRSDFLHLDS